MPKESKKTVFNACGVEFVAKSVLDQKWGEQFEKLGKYKEKHGHCNVPDKYIDPSDGTTLGAWVHEQRYAITCIRRLEEAEELGKWGRKKANAMKPHRIKALEELGFVKSVHKENWDKMVSQLKEYMSSHQTKDGKPSSDVSLSDVRKDPKLKKLYTWTDTQRYQKKNFDKGKDSSMTPKRLQELTELGFLWQFSGPREGEYRHTKKYKRSDSHNHDHLEYSRNYNNSKNVASAKNDTTATIATTLSKESERQNTDQPPKQGNPPPIKRWIEKRNAEIKGTEDDSARKEGEYYLEQIQEDLEKLKDNELYYPKPESEGKQKETLKKRSHQDILDGGKEQSDTTYQSPSR